MSIQITTRHFRPSSDLKHYLGELCEGIRQCFPDVLWVHMVIDETKGSVMTGAGKRCHIIVRCGKHLRIDVNEYQEDIWQSVDGAYSQLLGILTRYQRQEREVKSTISDYSMPLNNDVFTDPNVTVGPWQVQGVSIEEGCCHE